MRRHLLASILWATAALGARVTTFPPEPLYVGERITVEIDFGISPGSASIQEVPVSNFENLRHQFKNYQSSVFVVRGTPREAGEIVIGPILYRDRTNRTVQGPQVRLAVRPDIADGSKPIESLRALSRANRSVVVMTTTLKKPRHYAGEEVVVEWWAAGELDDTYIHDLPGNPLPVSGIDRTSLEIARKKKIDVVDGQFIAREMRAELHLFPKNPGTYSVPAVRFQGEDLRRTRMTDATTVERLEFFRTAPAIQFEVLPRPVHAAGPLGTFRMKCEPVNNVRYWPGVGVTIIGSGELDSAEAPRFSTKPTNTVVIIGNDPRIYERELWRSWHYEIHAPEGQLPPLTWSYFDTAKDQNVELRCEPAKVAIRTQANNPEPVVPNIPDAGLRGILEIGGALLLGASLMVLINAIRG
jgi:hypothetical protein